MAKYNVKLSCGHVTEMFLFGSESECKRTIAFWEKRGICPNCERERMKNENTIDCDEVEMFYGEYKKNYPNCKTKPGSYNGTTKTIIVYVPKK